MRSTDQIASDIRQITQLVTEPSDEATLECVIHGTVSGIPGAFVDALDRADPTGRATETLHELLVEYAEAVACSSPSTKPKVVILRFEGGKTSVSSK